MTPEDIGCAAVALFGLIVLVMGALILAAGQVAR